MRLVNIGLQLLAFRLRNRVRPREWLRRMVLRGLGLRMGPRTQIGRVSVIWPHQVCIGRDSQVLDGAVFDYCHGHWRPGPSIMIGDRTYVGRAVDFNCRQQISIGDDCLIAAGCRFIDHDHGTGPGRPMREQDGTESAIVLESDVWLGVNVVVLKGVTIGRGSVLAAGAVVTKSVPSYEIWGGVPARRLRAREQH